MNIFKTVKDVTSRIEPFHSRFLVDALSESVVGDRSLFDSVWRLVAPEGWKVPDEAEVCAEKEVDGGRIDIAIKCESPERRIVGVEVKTTDSSATPGQLKRYRDGLVRKHSEHKVAIAYLTPFNRQRAGDKAKALPTVKEFEEFTRLCPAVPARHVSWLDIAAIPWNGNELWRQHQQYVCQHISSQGKLDRSATRDRSLDKFFGGVCVDDFWEALWKLGIKSSDGGAVIDLGQPDRDVEFASRLAESFEILIKYGDGVSRDAHRSDAFGEDLRTRFLNSRHRKVHQALFDLADQHGYVWMKGAGDYGIRVAHANHTGGVSLVRSDSPERLKIVGQR